MKTLVVIIATLLISGLILGFAIVIGAWSEREMNSIAMSETRRNKKKENWP